jgi:predicted SAM-dependent methyltransferase
MWDIPLPDGSVDTIFSSNALEHISKFAIIPTLQEWHRLLKPGGRMQIVVPDLEWAVAFWLKMKDTAWATGWPLDTIYGHQKHEGEYHKTGFTPKILWDYLTVSANGGWFVHAIYYFAGDDKVPEGLNFEFDDIKEHVAQRLIVAEVEKVDPNKDYSQITSAFDNASS